MPFFKLQVGKVFFGQTTGKQSVISPFFFFWGGVTSRKEQNILKNPNKKRELLQPKKELILISSREMI